MSAPFQALWGDLEAQLRADREDARVRAAECKRARRGARRRQERLAQRDGDWNRLVYRHTDWKLYGGSIRRAGAR